MSQHAALATAAATPIAGAPSGGSLGGWLPDWAKLDFSTTPARARSARGMAIASCLAFCAMFIAYHGYITHAFQTIGRDSAPSIVMAEKIRFELADAHAALYGAAYAKNKAERDASMALARSMLDQARQTMILAAGNITYGEEESVPLTALARGLGSYDQALAAAEARNFDPASMAVADKAMKEQDLPAATALDQANYAHLDTAYSRHGANALVSGAPALLLGAALLCALAWAQIDLFRSSNRLLNKGYLAATVAAVAFFAVCAFSMLAAEAALKVAKKDAFTSVHALWLAKSSAYSAKAARGAMLLASGTADFPARQADWANASQAVSALDSRGMRMALGDSRPFGGYIGQAFENITFPGEREALTRMAKGWADYIDVPPALLAGAKTSKIEPNSEPAVLLLGRPAALAEFAAGLDEATRINQQVFDKEVDIAMARLRILPWLAIAMLLAVAAGAYFGAKARLDEYRF